MHSFVYQPKFQARRNFSYESRIRCTPSCRKFGRNFSDLFNLNKRYDLDGDFKFNTARLINHSCNPNCEVTGAGLKVWVHAIKDIRKNEEFSYDYGFGFDEDYKNYKCRCGSKNCCGYIIREGSRWRIKKNKSKIKK